MSDLKNLEVWKKARSFQGKVFNVCKTFPEDEKFSLIKQFICSTRSVSANIAEGYGRFHYKENIQFCRMARGSLYESLNHLICAKDCGFISMAEFLSLEQDIEEIGKMLNGYISYLKKRINSSE